MISTVVALGVLAFGTNASADTYTVKSGDTLSEISVDQKVSVKDIMKKNKGIKNKNEIFVGDKIELGKRVEKNENKAIVETPIVEEIEKIEEPTPVVEEVQPQPIVTNATSGADYVARRMAEETGVSYDIWRGVIFRESGDQAQIVNPTGHRGYLQIAEVHGNTDWSDEGQVQAAVKIFKAQGPGAWQAW